MSASIRSLKMLLAAALLLSGWQIGAQEPEPVIESPPSEAAPVADPPSRVARLSLIEGDVSVAPAGTDEWAEAVLNRPLTSGDRIYVDGDGRAEVQIGSATIHLQGGTGFWFIDLDDEAMRMSVTDGAVSIRVRRKADRETIEVSTPNTVVSLLNPGEYHIALNDAGDQTTVKTRSGESEVRGEGGTFLVRADEQGVFTGEDRLTADIGPISARTEFERWANERDRRDEPSESTRYVAEDVVGYQDLDRYGEWVSEPEYGHVWRPTYVVAGWAPYRYGRWVWVSPWGWNWVDSTPWGFAPFHYGRWAHVRSRWCWVPGPRHVRPVYAPALVGWYGGSHLSVSLSFGGGVGWFPLAPHEVYWPGYRHSHRYVRNVNISNTVIVNNNYFNDYYRGRNDHVDYRHRRDPHAVTMVHRDAFVGGRAIGDRRVHVSEGDLARWRGDSRPPSIAPERDSVFAGELRGNRPFTRLSHPNRQVTTDRVPRTRIPFDAERRAITANNGRPVDRSAIYDRPKDRSDFRVIGGRNGVKRTDDAGRGARGPSDEGAGPTTARDWRGRQPERDTLTPGNDRGTARPRYSDDGSGRRAYTNQREPSDLAMRPPQARRDREGSGDVRGSDRGSTRSPPSSSGEERVRSFRAAEPESPPGSMRSRPSPSPRGQEWGSNRSQRDAPGFDNSWRDRAARDDRSTYRQDRSSRSDGGARGLSQYQPQARQAQPSHDSGARRSMSEGHSSRSSSSNSSSRGDRSSSRGEGGQGRSGGRVGSRQQVQ